jgi:hypothetical protein
VTTYSFRPRADGSVGVARAVSARTPALVVGGARGGHRSYLTFAPAGMRGALADAALRVYVRDGSAAQVTVHRCSAGWTEAQLVKGGRPRIVGRPLARARPLRRGRWLQVSLPRGTAAVNRSLCLALSSAGRDSAAFGSRESSRPPRLVLTTTAP